MKVLIVENDEVVTKLWERWLSNFYTVETAGSVDVALEAIKKEMPEVILLDLRLNGPTHSGLLVYDYIREDLGEETPIIFITGLEYNVDLYQQAENKVFKDQENGLMTQMVQKPVGIKELDDLVKSAAA